MASRDSWLWTLGIVAAVLTYLGAAPAPFDWGWAEWVQFAAFVVATVSGKLATSPLRGQPCSPSSDRP